MSGVLKIWSITRVFLSIIIVLLGVLKKLENQSILINHESSVIVCLSVICFPKQLEVQAS